MKPVVYISMGVVVGVILGVLWGVFQPHQSVAPTIHNSNTNQSTTTSVNTNSTSSQPNFSTSDLPDRDGKLNFSAHLPSGWAAEYVSGSHAINIYDPRATGSSNLEKSKIFITYFEASNFQTLTTVDVKSSKVSTINGQPAMTYVIIKKAGQADFTDQPSWRNSEHTVTDIRSSDASPAVFYAFAQAPDVDQATFDDFLQSIIFSS